MRTDAQREDIWCGHGASPAEAAELTAYARSAFDLASPTLAGPFPLDDEPSVAAWEAYARDAAASGVAVCLTRHLPQLRFPIAAGMGEDAAYRAATRRGIWPAADAGPGVTFVDPDGLRLFVHPTAAGRIPVIVARAREDFVSLVRALTARNEPEPVLGSLGAMMVGGYTNWERLETLRAASGTSTLTPELLARKPLYQDRFILLSSGPYSAVSAGDLGLTDDDWLARSLTIRLEHECAHYFTRRVLGSMRNRLLDELMADYAGLVAGAGRYRADWFLRFMGLEVYPAYRTGARLEHYRGDPPLTPGAFTILQRALLASARHLEHLDTRTRQSRTAQSSNETSGLPPVARTLVTIADLGLEGLSVAPTGGD